MLTRGIPSSIRAEVMGNRLALYCFRQLAVKDHVCGGRITWEHAITYKGQRINEVWAIIPLCSRAHNIGLWQDNGVMSKKINEWIALSRITNWDEVQEKYPKNNWRQRLKYLNGEYGRFNL